MGIFSSHPSEPIKSTSYLVPEIPELSTNRKIFAIAYSFIGTGLHGLQYQNPDTETIETIIFETMINANVLPPDAMINKGVLKWSQCSRTDAGVHSVGQVLSLYLFIDNSYPWENIAQLLNQNIPERVPKDYIKFWAVIPIMPSFVAQKMANAREYQYLMPISAFGSFFSNENNVITLHQIILPEFVGHKNFHNYSTSISRSDPYRDIYKFDFSKPFKIKNNDFVLWTIHGNSFALNQIRKMLASVLAYAHGKFSLDDIRASLTEKKVHIEMIPGDGLFLNKVEYTPILRHFFPHRAPPKSNDVEFNMYRPQIDKWKLDVLFPHIVDVITSQNVFDEWIQNKLPYCHVIV